MRPRQAIRRGIDRRPSWVALLAFVFCLALGAPQKATAQSEQLYFVGFEARTGSISAEGGSAVGVYLRWDTVEGELPNDLASFRLERDGNPLPNATLSATDVMSAAEIDALYQDAEQSRRKAETLSALAQEVIGRQAQAVLDGENTPACASTNVTAANFAAALRQKIDSLGGCYDSFWSAMASRLDFNVARARNRGWVDTDVLASGPHEYELIAIATNLAEVTVGRIEVSVDGVADQLPAAGGFVRRDLARCDAPERSKDHGSVALFWDFATANPTEQLRDGLLTSGFDLYRSQADPGALTNLKIRTLAQAESHGTEGEITLAGLDRINSRPILVSGAPDPDADGVEREERYQGWNPPFVQFVESPEALAEAGVEPGEWRNYYLVARDLSGNYGDSAEIRVRIPDVVPPPPPWDVRVEKDSFDDSVAGLTGSFELVWDHVDVRNYHSDHLHDRTYCNLNTARFDRRLIYAPGDTLCEDSGLREVDLDVEKYIVYRFASPKEAQDFADTDGDGRGDALERTVLTGAPTWLTDPGLACDPDAWPPVAPDLRVVEIDLVAGPPAAATWQVENADDGRTLIRWRDVDPAGPAGEGYAGDVYWYALASVDADGNVSPLSAPVRGFFPDRTRPSRDAIECGRRECPISAEKLSEGDSNLPFAYDTTEGGLADFARVTCPDPYGTMDFQVDYPIVELPNGVRGVEATCSDLLQVTEFGCFFLANIEFHNNAGTLTDAQGDTPTVVYESGIGTPGVSDCSSLRNAFLKQSCDDYSLIPLRPGEILDESPFCRPAVTPGDCITVYRRIGDKRFKWKTFCDLTGFSLDVPTSGGEPVCLSLTLQNANNVASAHYNLPCVSMSVSPIIEAPQPLGIVFPTNGTILGTIQWLPPQQHVVGTLLQWNRSDGAYGGATFVPHTGHSAADGPLSYGEVSLGAVLQPGDPDEEWCFQARSVGPNASNNLSEWSARLCEIRLPPGETYPDYLPWPKIDEPKQIETLEAVYLPHADDGFAAILITENLSLSGQDTGTIPDCLGQGSCFVALDAEVTGYHADFCPNLREGAAPRLGFVAYRQSRANSDDTPSEYHQISPLIDRLHCWESVADASLIWGHLEDPFLKLVSFDPVQTLFHPNELGLVFIDRSSHEVGRQYRYQLVYFGADGEIVGYRTTNWVTSVEAP